MFLSDLSIAGNYEKGKAQDKVPISNYAVVNIVAKKGIN